MTKTLRILHVIDSFDLGGAQTFLLDLVRHLDRKRFVAEVAAMHGHGVFEPSFQNAGIKTHSLSPAKWPPCYLMNFPHLLLQEKFDMLHFHLFGANLCAKPLAIAMGCRALVVHDQCNDASRDQSFLLLAADTLANRGASRIIAVSESVRRYLLDHEDLPESKVVMIPNGIDTEEFSPPTLDQKMRARELLGLPEGRLIIGGVGRLVPQKNFKLFLDVAARVRASHSEVEFVIAGSGPLKEELRHHADQLGIAEQVRFLGHVTNRVALNHALDALLMPSDFEGTPMTLLEAMSTELPIVASAVDGIAEVCSDGHDALLVGPNDLSGFTTALERVVTDNAMRAMIGCNARRTIVARYEIHNLVKRIEHLYEEVLAEQGG